MVQNITWDNVARIKTGSGERWRSWWFCCSWVVRLVCMVVVMVDVWVKVHLVVGVVGVVIVDVHLVAFMYDLAGSSAASSESASSLSERSVWRRKWRSG